MPTQPKIIALYITHLSTFSKYSTLKRRLASISILHKTKGHYIDTKHPIIMENLMGIKRTNGSNQKGKKPLLINDLKLLINAIDQSNEKNKRKIYAGGIGYFSANGDFDTCIALRTALAKNGKYYVQAGAGIVADSI